MLPHVPRRLQGPHVLLMSLQELKAHCGMLVRTYNELQQMHSRLLQAAAGAPPQFSDAEYKRQRHRPSSPQAHLGNRRVGDEAPETPEQEAVGGPLGMPGLQLAESSPDQMDHPKAGHVGRQHS